LYSNDEVINLQMKHIKGGQVSPTGIPYLEFILIFRKTNKDPNKGEFQIVDINGVTEKQLQASII